MPLQIVRNDITKMKVDAIVNAVSNSLLSSGGVSGCIHRAAGPELASACLTLGGCETGRAKITAGYRLPSRFVIHTAGPVWQDGRHGEPELLASCYRSSLILARDAGCTTVAFPLISSGIYGYPKEQALRVAVDAIGAFLMENDITVFLVVFDRSAYRISSKLFSDIASCIDDRYADRQFQRTAELHRLAAARSPDKTTFMAASQDAAPCSVSDFQASCTPPSCTTASVSRSLDEALQKIDESFSEMLLRKIDERGITDAQCYKKANIDRKLFSKIRSDKGYRPSKPTVIAFALALELPMHEMKSMLEKAGFALSHSSKFDIIVEYFVEHGNYNVFEINEALFAFDQSLIGA